MNAITVAQAHEMMMAKGRDELCAIVYNISGISLADKWTASQLLTWFTAHYIFNERDQEWTAELNSTTLH